MVVKELFEHFQNSSVPIKSVSYHNLDKIKNKLSIYLINIRYPFRYQILQDKHVLIVAINFIVNTFPLEIGIHSVVR